MSEELTPEQKFAADDAEAMVPRALLLGKRPDDIVADLVRLDWSPAAARSLVDRFVAELQSFRESAESRRLLIDQARNQFVAGFLLAVVGFGIAAISLLAGARGITGFWVPAFFCFFGGLVVCGRGWSRWRLYRRWAQQLERAREMETRDSSDRDPQS